VIAAAPTRPATWRLDVGVFLAVIGICVVVAQLECPAATIVALLAMICVPFIPAAPRGAIALGLLWAVLTTDNPQENPADGKWQSPLYPLGSLLFDNLNKSTGIEALHFSTLDVEVVVLTLAACWHRPRTIAATCLPLRDLCVIAALTLAGIEAWGLLTGGDVRNSLWQVRQPAAAPLLVLAFSQFLDIRRHQAVLGFSVLSAAAVKAAFGLYVYEAIYRPLNEKPPFVTTHSDSVLFVAAMIIVSMFAASRRTWGAVALAALALPCLGVAVVINNRRLAWVELGLSALVLYLLLPPNRLKQALTRTALAMVPVAGLYVAVGWSSNASVFLPVRVLRSLGDSNQDRSAATRDIENYNLVQTLKVNPLLGVGFGHEYKEVSRADDISTYFPQYRFIPHNSFLGLWAFGGALGFTFVWLPLAAGLFLAARSFRCARTSIEQTTAITLVGVVVAYTVQCWGDMGLQSWPATFLNSAALACAGQLAVEVGAWPSLAAQRDSGVQPGAQLRLSPSGATP
jgi:hypothetical protein